MKLWFTAQELADMGLSGLPGTESGIIRCAKRENWAFRKREGRGGGREYPLEALPEKAEADYRERQEKEIRKQEVILKKQKLSLKQQEDRKETALISVTQLNARQRSTMEARAAIVHEINLRSIETGSFARSIHAISNESLNGDLRGDLAQLAITANDKSTGSGFLSERTLYRWYSAYKKGGVAALAPKVTREKDPEPEWTQDFFHYHGKKQKPSIKETLREWKRNDPERALPSYDQVKRFWQKLPELTKMRGRYGILAIRNVMAYKVRDVSHLFPASVYAADGKTFDAEVAHPRHGQPFKPEITTVVDVYSRRIVGWSVALAESTLAVMDALRVACCNASIPAIFYSDNGPGYKNNMMEADLTGFLVRLSITPSHSLPYNSQAKGVVERVNHLWNEAARKLPTYLGELMDKQEATRIHKLVRRELKEKGQSQYLLEWPGFVELIGDTVRDYNNREHEGLPKVWDHDLGRKRHMTPNEVWKQSVTQGWEPVSVDLYEIDDLFRPWEIRPVRRCMVELYTNSYFSEDLNAYHNRKVIVAFDIHDVSKIWIREVNKTEDGLKPGKLICIAQLNGNKTSYYPKSYIEQKEEQRIKGLIRRREAHVEIAKQERRDLYIDHQPVQPVINIPVRQAVPVEVIEEIPSVAMAESGLRLGPNGRPIFSNDEDYAAWLLANPQSVNDRDVEYLTDLLSSHTSKNLLRMAGIDLDALCSLVLNAAA